MSSLWNSLLSRLRSSGHPPPPTQPLPQPLIEGSGETVNKMMTAGDWGRAWGEKRGFWRSLKQVFCPRPWWVSLYRPILIMAACQRGWAHLLIVPPVLLVQHTASMESWPECVQDLVGECQLLLLYAKIQPTPNNMKLTPYYDISQSLGADGKSITLKCQVYRW